MPIKIEGMKGYLSKSLSSVNENKINGLLAEIDFRSHLTSLGFKDRVSIGGWILRNNYHNQFGEHTVAVFPHIIEPDTDYPEPTSYNSVPPLGLHTICATFHQLGINSYYAKPMIDVINGRQKVTWKFLQLGLPYDTEYCDLADVLKNFTRRSKEHDFLENNTNVSGLPQTSIPGEFSKENLRVFMHSQFYFEISDIDGLLWGERFTYPLEIKEKTPATDKRLGGKYFGLDIGPFTKLAFFSARSGNLRSLYVIREIDNKATRKLVEWRFIRYEKLAQYASWQSQSGGKNMIGEGSTVIMIPMHAFSILDLNEINQL